MKNKNLIVVLILLAISFTSCSSKQETIEVKIQAIDIVKNQPRKNIKVEVLKVKNPLFSMRRFILFHTLRTNDEGFISFKTSEKGDYSIRFFRDTIRTDRDYVSFYRIDTLKIKDLEEDKVFKLRW
ncbi:hypothetical protein SAMN05444344_0382 [Tenacibaculum mesophilum]|uniref:Carboxypeptidase regulatory-like domain-containing protein n=1 Tax=Tenacibaculum mesophilum TaxID=104268 RepID=A0ABN5TCS5_9FLAO|nr:hypothetical protein [Tenacibaculum mesophilum]AZJ33791.1 hypothetical protein D6200_14940 [Tenacibaculum mesophilum]QFS29033.1 hypothetical protein F9Y86_11745 [Tenacibaculum mesophilum]SHF53623.1 hypothetical protein SAMN05444344_0382 [Tenacibaculum mesophilum]